ncbi:hypothetical protein niasHS_004472 [Heterodera schachtii]|uniref:MATH domain-containing protein n=1 Tax=Heterodera schachtii TaxID=97005 RepID=A0ABD2JJ77_HETSC
MFRYDEQNSKNPTGKDHATKKNPILVPDIEIEAFKAMLTFAYMKRFNGLNANNWLDVLMAADKYNISGLVKKCADFPIEKLPNIFIAFEKAQLLNMEDFSLRCLHYIDQNISALIKSKAFLQIDQDLLCEILERDQLRISEIEIWNAVIRWSDEQCRQKGIECSAENRGKMLGPALFNIRFPLIPKEDFTKSVVPTDVLTTKEVISVYQHYSHQNLSDVPGLFPLKFPTHQRYKYEYTIEMEIEKVSEFALEEKYSRRRSSDAVDIWGFSCAIEAEIRTKDESNEKCLGFYLFYVGPKEENLSFQSSAALRIVSQKNGTEDLIGRRSNDIFNKEWSSHGNWSRKCSATLRIVSKKSDVEDFKREFDRTYIFNNNSNNWGFVNFISFAELMDPSKGFYNEDEDKITLAIDFTCN